MRRTRMTSLALMLAGAVTLQVGAAGPASAWQDPQQSPAPPEYQLYSAEQLDNLLAPIALYADPLLAQVLLAATFPEQIADAAQYVRRNGTGGIDEQAWDVSVKAVAHYPTVLNTLDTRMDWTTALGQAYAGQSTDVMRAVQRLRQMARAQGNLVTTPEQEVVYSDGFIRIWPAQPRVIYVPVYDPAVVYVRPIHYHRGYHAWFSFGVPFPLGAWLIYDWDWPRWRIYYTGWYGGGWIGRSRPYIHITNVYVHPRYTRVWYGRDVMHRYPNYGRIAYYDAIHPGFRDRGGYQPRHTVPSVRDGAAGGGAPYGDNTRRAVPRAGGGANGRADGAAVPRVLPVETRAGSERPRVDAPLRSPSEAAPGRVEAERRPGVDQPSRVAPADAPPRVERPAWESARPSWEPTARDRAETRSAVPPSTRERVEARPSYEPQQRERVEARPEPQQRERVEARPSYQPPRDRGESRPAASPAPRDRGGDSRPSSSPRSGGGNPSPRSHDRRN